MVKACKSQAFITKYLTKLWSFESWLYHLYLFMFESNSQYSKTKWSSHNTSWVLSWGSFIKSIPPVSSHYIHVYSVVLSNLKHWLIFSLSKLKVSLKLIPQNNLLCSVIQIFTVGWITRPKVGVTTWPSTIFTLNSLSMMTTATTASA